jgi:hypothetical protein
MAVFPTMRIFFFDLAPAARLPLTSASPSRASCPLLPLPLSRQRRITARGLPLAHPSTHGRRARCASSRRRSARARSSSRPFSLGSLGASSRARRIRRARNRSRTKSLRGRTRRRGAGRAPRRGVTSSSRIATRRSECRARSSGTPLRPRPRRRSSNPSKKASGRREESRERAATLPRKAVARFPSCDKCGGRGPRGVSSEGGRAVCGVEKCSPVGKKSPSLRIRLAPCNQLCCPEHTDSALCAVPVQRATGGRVHPSSPFGVCATSPRHPPHSGSTMSCTNEGLGSPRQYVPPWICSRKL